MTITPDQRHALLLAAVSTDTELAALKLRCGMIVDQIRAPAPPAKPIPRNAAERASLDDLYSKLGLSPLGKEPR